MAKDFLITIDTEADNQWDFDHEISTENAKFLPRFQELAEKYALLIFLLYLCHSYSPNMHLL